MNLSTEILASVKIELGNDEYIQGNFLTGFPSKRKELIAKIETTI